MEELRVAFLVIGGIAIAGILVHGLWSVRKNNEAKSSARLETRDWQNQDVDDDSDDYQGVEIDADLDEDKQQPRFSSGNYDDLGLGAVRVVSRASDTQDSEVIAPVDNCDTETTDISQSDSQFVAPQTDEEVAAKPVVDAPKPKIYSSVVTQPKPEYAAEQVNAMRSRFNGADSPELDEMPEPPPFLLKTQDEPKVGDINTSEDVEQVKSQPVETQPQASAEKIEPKFELDEQVAAPEPVQAEEKVSLAEQARNFVKRSKAETKPRKRREPKIREDQMRIDFDEPSLDVEKADSQQQKIEPQESPSTAKQEVLVLNVKASDDAPIQGAALLPMLLTLGFKFGDQDIFHRHVNSNGKGPVLFSLANMFKPGIFDIDNLENFSTQGVSLFMMLPIEGDPHQVFNMMHNAARKIADEFKCQVLDGRRSALTKQSLQQYVEKIREFERQRIIAR